MKRIVYFGVAIALMFAACKKDNINNENNNGNNGGGNNGIEAPEKLEKDIDQNTVLKAGKTYTLSGVIYVKNGATITIEAGTVIKATSGKTALVITRGAKIDAVGTPDRPIVFTSVKDNPNPTLGDNWGGIVILGKATTNAKLADGTIGQGEIEGGINLNNMGLYGGTDDADNSGRLKYVRIEHAGYPFQTDKELNSLTLGAVGNKTEIDHIQVSYAYDDAYEMFGGTVDLKYIISYRTNDDDFDCDNGYRGRIQYAIAVRDKAINDVSGGNGFEQDNDAGGTTATPITAPIFSNVTIIGPAATGTTPADWNTNYAKARLAHLRRNTQTSVYNSILMAYPTGILLDGTSTAANFTSGALDLRGLIIAGTTKALDVTTGVDLTAFTTGFNAADRGNRILTTNEDVKLKNAFDLLAFDPTPAAGSPALTGADFTKGKLANNAFFTKTTFVGAVGGDTDTWWKGWTRFFNR